MRSAGKPVSAGEVATLSGLDRKEVDKAFAQLKKDGAIVSPVRCKWQIPMLRNTAAPIIIPLMFIIIKINT